MVAPEMTLAVPREIIDNGGYAGVQKIWLAPGIMSQDARKEPVWGTSDKARLADLVSRGRQGDLMAMESLYEMFKRPVLGLAYRHTMNSAAAEDLLQDISLSEIEETVVIESSRPVARDLKEPLAKAIQSLPPRLKSVFVLHDVEGYKHEEISRLLGCSVGTSKSQLFKARMKLRVFLRARNIA